MEKKMEHEVEEKRPQLTEAREQVVEVNRKFDLLLDRTLSLCHRGPTSTWHNFHLFIDVLYVLYVFYMYYVFFTTFHRYIYYMLNVFFNMFDMLT
jgi:hypothetical protein